MATLLIIQTVVYLIRPMVSYEVLALGGEAGWVGLVAASYAVLSLLAAIPLGRWVDSGGEVPFIFGGAVIVAVAAVLTARAGSLLALALSQALLGLGQVFNIVAVQSLLANMLSRGARDSAFGYFTVVVSMGQLIGPALAGTVVATAVSADGPVEPSTDRAFALATALSLSACVVACVLWRGAPRGKRRTSTEPAASLLSVARLPKMGQAMFASVAVLTAADLLIAYLPVYGVTKGLSAAEIGFMLSARAASSLGSRLLLGVMTRAVGRGRLMVFSTALPAALLCLIPMVSNRTGLTAIMVAAGFGLGLGQPLSMSWVAQVAPRGIRATALAVRLSGNRLAQIVLPTAVGALAGATGPGGAFISMGCFLAASSAVSFGAIESFDSNAPPT
jgi:MFS family permease